VPHNRKARSGFTLIEVAIAAIIIVIVTMAAGAYYAESRIQEIRGWQEQNALYLAEREIDLWQAQGYTALTGFNAGQVSPNFLPYGYRFGQADPAWNQTGGFKQVTLDGVPYRVRAMMLQNASSSTTDYYVQGVIDGIPFRYRPIVVYVQWGNFQTGNVRQVIQETRLAR
jgi:prepilin-type N-terminal cleavage/methylation domain-containing protein